MEIMNKNKRIAHAKKVAQELSADEVIIISRTYSESFDAPSDITVSTYGKTKKGCKFAGDFGNQIMQIIKKRPRTEREALEIFDAN